MEGDLLRLCHLPHVVLYNIAEILSVACAAYRVAQLGGPDRLSLAMQRLHRTAVFLWQILRRIPSTRRVMALAAWSLPVIR